MANVMNIFSRVRLDSMVSKLVKGGMREPGRHGHPRLGPLCCDRRNAMTHNASARDMWIIPRYRPSLCIRISGIVMVSNPWILKPWGDTLVSATLNTTATPGERVSTHSIAAAMDVQESPCTDVSSPQEHRLHRPSPSRLEPGTRCARNARPPSETPENL